MSSAPGSSAPPGSRWTTPARATRLRTVTAPRSAMRISPGSAPRSQRAAATSSNCCAPAMAITSSMPRRWPICANAASPDPVIALLAEHPDRCFPDRAAWTAHLEKLGIAALKVTPDPVMVATEGALWGSIKAHGFLPNTVIVSDDAGQFNVGQHALCWIHAERLVHKLDTFTDEQRAAQSRIRAPIWRFYRALKAYRQHPTTPRKAVLSARFDRIFTHKTGFVPLDRQLTRLHANKAELLMVLERPEIPLHTNTSENDVRCQVTKRKVSGGTRSDLGRDCRDAFLGLVKTCAKQGITFWDYLGSRLQVPDHWDIPYLPQLIRHRCASS